jgi:hypothetical protein
MSQKGVQITSHDGQVDQSTITVSKSVGDAVTWHSHDNKAATIKFDSEDGSPFQNATFNVPPGGSVSSGPALSHVDHKPYKYTVVGPDGENDPIVIVDN